MKANEYLERITPFGFSGACLVGRGADVVLNAGYGLAVRDRGLANTPETVFSLGSVTKQFTAAAVLKLEDDGLVRTDDPLGRFFDAPADKAEITLHQLLTHTAGFAMYTGDDFEPAPRDETMAKAFAQALRFTPGSDYAYSNVGYSVLAAIVELVSGEAYEQFLCSRLLKPARLEATGYRLPDWSSRTIAHWYTGDVDNGTPLEKPYPSWNLMGNGDMLSTTDDMWRWHRALAHDLVLTPRARRKLFTPYVRDYGYGWNVVEGDRGLAVQHGGASSYGTSCTVKRFLDADVFLVLFCNAAYGPGPLAHAVEDHVVAAAFGEDVPLPPLLQPGSPAVAGDYLLPSGGRILVRGGTIRTRDQDAIDELAYGGCSRERLNVRAAQLVSSVLNGDDRPLREEVNGDTERLERYRSMIGGLSRQISFARTLPSHLPGVPATHVAAGDAAIAFYWRDGTLLGVSEGEPEAVYELPLAGGVAYDLRTGRAVGVTFEAGGLTLSTNGRNVQARRLAS